MEGDSQPGRNGGTLKRGGNPKKKGAVNLTTRLEKVLREQVVIDKETGAKQTRAEILIRAMIVQAAKGNGAAMKIIFDRVDGPLTQKVVVDVKEIPDDRLIALLEANS